MYDYLEISYGSFSWKYCGDQVPPPIISSGLSMRVKFHSDNIGAKTGFLFKWEELEGDFFSVLVICLPCMNNIDIRKSEIYKVKMTETKSNFSLQQQHY